MDYKMVESILCKLFKFEKRYHLSFDWHYGKEEIWNISSKDIANAKIKKWRNTFKSFEIKNVKIKSYLVKFNA